ncbi:metallophosphoesterase family protein [Sphingomonas naphthae]|uniref:Metallophosphoesterase family protein n=1 Tax=Sphingomonas naphthae TaxID=1813468 RepID=A0ABY7TLK1_9SPHN|nr:metallophosphoesterase family protein [Sphingomonas naphthae]WCT74118.1 metallophosphoesterase family protein [Sphingomonas naphthae]
MKRLFGRAPEASAPSLPPGLRVYAIGDVHGRLDRLMAVEAAIAAHIAAHPPEGDALVIFIGDYVDRGPDSRGVIEALAGLRFAGLPARCLMGNHEDAMLQFLESAAIGPAWFEYGGMATLASYGVKPAGPESVDRFERLRQGLVAILPDSHRRFLGDLELSIELGDYLFVHAGVRPSRAIDQQQRDDLLTIREPFLSHDKRLALRVVHGHTVTDRPVFRQNRIGIDTGAYATGMLTCLLIEGEAASILPVA